MLGSLLKCKMRSGALEGRIFGSKDEYMKRMLEEIDDDTNLEDLVFENKDDAFCWLKSCIEKANDRYSRKFISIELIWVADEAIPRNLVNEKRCSKIKGIKKYNSAAAVEGKVGVFVRDTSCADCPNCMKGNVLDCSQNNRNGEWQHHVIDREAVNDVNFSDDDSDEEIEEFVYDSAIDDSGEESEEEEDVTFQVLQLAELSQGQYVLYRWVNNTYYVGAITDLSKDGDKTEISLSLMKKHATREDRIIFSWPHSPHMVVIDDLPASKCLYWLPDPIIGRRGSSIDFKLRVFGTIDYNSIC